MIYQRTSAVVSRPYNFAGSTTQTSHDHAISQGRQHKYHSSKNFSSSLTAMQFRRVDYTVVSQHCVLAGSTTPKSLLQNKIFPVVSRPCNFAGSTTTVLLSWQGRRFAIIILTLRLSLYVILFSKNKKNKKITYIICEVF